MANQMTLKVLLPYRVIVEEAAVRKIVIETHEGSYGFLPNRLDCVVAIEQGIMTYERADNDEVYVAVDEGILVKTGNHVQVSVRNAFTGSDLGKLQEMMEREFMTLSEREKNVKKVISKLESEFIRRYVETRHE